MKKAISIALAFVLILSTLVGCSKPKEEGDSAPTQANQRITVDSHYQYDESVMYAYQKLCDAVYNGSESASFNTQLLNDVSQLFYTSFPLNALVSEVKLLEDKSGVSLTYTNSLEVHLQLVSEFKDRVDSILNECGLGSATMDEYIVNVYSYIANNFTVSNDNFSAYDTLMNSNGVAAAVNQVFEYLLICGKCEASHIIKTDGVTSFLSYVKFNGVYYYFDVANEIVKNEGKALVYFAMDDARLSAYAPGQHLFTDKSEVPSVTDDTYSKLANSKSYEFSDRTLSVDCGESSPYIVEI